MTGGDFRFVLIEQLAGVEIVPGDILVEPAMPQLRFALQRFASKHHRQALTLAAPSNHMILEGEGFRSAITAGVSAALDGQLVTFGIRPSRPETGYGWLELSQSPSDDFAPQPQALRSFFEKPDAVTAQSLLDGGMRLWNAGIFVFSTTSILEALSKHSPEVLKATRVAFEVAQKDLSFTRLDPDAWQSNPNISIDCEVMERDESLTVVSCSGAWSDLGDWDAVLREQSQMTKALSKMGRQQLSTARERYCI